MSLASHRHRFRVRRRLPRGTKPPLGSGAPGARVQWPEKWVAYLRDAWARLHRRALARRGDDSKWLEEFARALPCGACREHWNLMLLRTPPDWGAYFAWTCKVHNEVSRALGKPEMPLAEALARWSPAE